MKNYSVTCNKIIKKNIWKTKTILKLQFKTFSFVFLLLGFSTLMCVNPGLLTGGAVLKPPHSHLGTPHLEAIEMHFLNVYISFWHVYYIRHLKTYFEIILCELNIKNEKIYKTFLSLFLEREYYFYCAHYNNKTYLNTCHFFL